MKLPLITMHAHKDQVNPSGVLSVCLEGTHPDAYMMDCSSVTHGAKAVAIVLPSNYAHTLFYLYHKNQGKQHTLPVLCVSVRKP